MQLPFKAPNVAMEDLTQHVIVRLAKQVIEKASANSKPKFNRTRNEAESTTRKFMRGQIHGGELLEELWRLLWTYYPGNIAILCIPLAGGVILLVSYVVVISCRAYGKCQYVKKEPETSIGYALSATALCLVTLFWTVCFTVLMSNVRVIDRVHEATNSTSSQIDMFRNFFEQTSGQVACIMRKTKTLERELAFNTKELDQIFKIITARENKIIFSEYGKKVKVYAEAVVDMFSYQVNIQEEISDVKQAMTNIAYKKFACKADFTNTIGGLTGNLTSAAVNAAKDLTSIIDGSYSGLQAWTDLWEELVGVSTSMRISINQSQPVIVTIKHAEEVYRNISKKLGSNVRIFSSSFFESQFEDKKLIFARALQRLIYCAAYLAAGFLATVALYVTIAYFGYTPYDGLSWQCGVVLGTGGSALFCIGVVVDVVAILVYLLGFGGRTLICTSTSNRYAPISEVVPMEKLIWTNADAIMLCLTGNKFQESFFLSEPSERLNADFGRMKGHLENMTKLAEAWESKRNRYLSLIQLKLSQINMTRLSNYLKNSSEAITKLQSYDETRVAADRCEVSSDLQTRTEFRTVLIKIRNKLDKAAKKLTEISPTMLEPKRQGLLYADVYDDPALEKIRRIGGFSPEYGPGSLLRDMNQLKDAKCSVLNQALKNIATNCERLTQNIDIIWINLMAIGILAYPAAFLMLIMAKYHSPSKYRANSYREKLSRQQKGDRKRKRFGWRETGPIKKGRSIDMRRR